jgi:hypothetical protein
VVQRVLVLSLGYRLCAMWGLESEPQSWEREIATLATETSHSWDTRMLPLL